MPDGPIGTSPSDEDAGPRRRLLDAAIDRAAERGLGDLSLRALAEELGTSHRMLSHHFGSKDGLWLAIVEEVERRQRAALAELLTAIDDDTDPASVMRRWWAHLTDPALLANARLFFELYGQALVGRQPAVRLLEGDIESWVESAGVGVGSELGPEVRAFLRLGIAVTRGLLLDLLATGDRVGVDAAMEQWIVLAAPVVAAARD